MKKTIYLLQISSLAVSIFFLPSCESTKSQLTGINQQMNDMNRDILILENKHATAIDQKKEVLKEIENSLTFPQNQDTALQNQNTTMSSTINDSPGSASQTQPDSSADIQSVSLDTVLAPTPTPAQNVEETAVERFRSAYDDYNNGLYELAAAKFQRVFELSNNDNVKSLALFWAGESYFKSKNWRESLPFFVRLENLYPQSPMLPSAYLKMGYAQIELSNVPKGIQMLNYLILHYPDSDEAKLAKMRMEELSKTP